MTETIEKRYTKAEIARELRDGLEPIEKTITIETAWFIELFSYALYRIQEETERRVKAEMLRRSLN